MPVGGGVEVSLVRSQRQETAGRPWRAGPWCHGQVGRGMPAPGLLSQGSSVRAPWKRGALGQIFATELDFSSWPPEEQKSKLETCVTDGQETREDQEGLGNGEWVCVTSPWGPGWQCAVEQAFRPAQTKFCGETVQGY